MTALENEIFQTLKDLDAQVKQISLGGPKPNLIPVFHRLDSLGAQLPANSDPTLRHYLHKKSYEKALLFLAGRENENKEGTCGH